MEHIEAIHVLPLSHALAEEQKQEGLLDNSVPVDTHLLLFEDVCVDVLYGKAVVEVGVVSYFLHVVDYQVVIGAMCLFLVYQLVQSVEELLVPLGLLSQQRNFSEVALALVGLQLQQLEAVEGGAKVFFVLFRKEVANGVGDQLEDKVGLIVDNLAKARDFFQELF